MRFAAVLLLGIAVLAVALLRPRFADTPLDVREAAAAAGLVITADGIGDVGAGSFFISRQPLAFPTQEYNRSLAHGWLDVVVVTRRSAEWQPDAQPGMRVWGRWVAVGDASLLDDLEKLLDH